LIEEEVTCFCEAAFNQIMDEKMMRRLDTLTFDYQHITAHYTGGYDENDMGHIFDLNADLETLHILITHCR
jgi:hypothetical protein